MTTSYEDKNTAVGRRGDRTIRQYKETEERKRRKKQWELELLHRQSVIVAKSNLAHLLYNLMRRTAVRLLGTWQTRME